ncbi:MAG: DinB family protein [Bacteroidetes bacterium]|nr:DinB family protein [Bacteroidota bacterium]MBS1973678.1 DinB family protein [Bacteroidota bacterium]
MSLFNKKTFLAELIDRTEIITSNTRSFFRLDHEQLNYKPASDKWSISEIYQHLNSINRVYNSNILQKVSSAPDSNIAYCKSGWMGDWVYEKLMPRPDGTVYKINSPKNFRSVSGACDAFDMLNEFIEQQNVMHDILTNISTKNLNRNKIPFYLSKLLKFRLADTLRFIVAHNERHLMQAYQVMEKTPVVQKG